MSDGRSVARRNLFTVTSEGGAALQFVLRGEEVHVVYDASPA
ncbi:hypothetical protein ACVLV4_002813 [Rathayibacter agropyri]